MCYNVCIFCTIKLLTLLFSTPITIISCDIIVIAVDQAGRAGQAKPGKHILDIIHVHIIEKCTFYRTFLNTYQKSGHKVLLLLLLILLLELFIILYGLLYFLLWKILLIIK